MSDNNVVAIIVTYNPDAESFFERLYLISNQVSRIVIVDNSDDCSWFNEEQFKSIADFIPLGENKGIAYAQNVGVFEAYKLNAEYLITFDQDSKIPDDFVNNLINEYLYVSGVIGESKIACIGPSVVNERDGKLYTKYLDKAEQVTENIYSVRSIISSGTLFNTKVFCSVGLMAAPWFIDSIDTEWCYRARAYGMHVLMTKNVSISHNLGDNDLYLPLGLTINIGAPVRLYYIYRNWIHSLRLPYFPVVYKLKLLSFMPIKLMIFSMINPGGKRFKFILKGIVDGIQGKYGAVGK